MRNPVVYAAAMRRFQVSYIALRNGLTGKSDPKQSRRQIFVPLLERLESIKEQLRDLEKEVRRL